MLAVSRKCTTRARASIPQTPAKATTHRGSTTGQSMRARRAAARSDLGAAAQAAGSASLGGGRPRGPPNQKGSGTTAEAQLGADSGLGAARASVAAVAATRAISEAPRVPDRAMVTSGECRVCRAGVIMNCLQITQVRLSSNAKTGAIHRSRLRAPGRQCYPAAAAPVPAVGRPRRLAAESRAGPAAGPIGHFLLLIGIAIINGPVPQPFEQFRSKLERRRASRVIPGRATATVAQSSGTDASRAAAQAPG